MEPEAESKLPACCPLIMPCCPQMMTLYVISCEDKTEVSHFLYLSRAEGRQNCWQLWNISGADVLVSVCASAIMVRNTASIASADQEHMPSLLQLMVYVMMLRRRPWTHEELLKGVMRKGRVLCQQWSEAHHIGMLDVGGHNILPEALDLAVDVCGVLNDLHRHHGALPAPCTVHTMLIPALS